LTALTDANWLLSIPLNDPSQVSGDDPRWTKRGKLLGFFQGLLHKRCLSTKGVHLDSSDVDRILQAYDREGESALAQLRGSFVLAIVDTVRSKALFARDPMGSHPLFYATTASTVLFAEKPTVLLQQPGVSRKLNRAALADHLCHRWPYPTETFYSAVRRVPPGSLVSISSGNMRIVRYWDPEPAGAEFRWLTEEESDRFPDVFERAVERALGHGKAAIFLSGGLDSISVAAVARDCSRRNAQVTPLALSLGFPDPECDESDRQQAIASHLGLPQTLLGFEEALGSRPLFQQALEISAKASAPLMNAWQPAYLELGRRARLEGVQTILTGEGGDEWLSITPYLAADLIGRGALWELAELVGAMKRSFKLPTVQFMQLVIWRCGLLPLLGRTHYRLRPLAHEAGRLDRLVAGDPTWLSGNLRNEQRYRAEDALVSADPLRGFYLRELRTGLDHALISWEAEERHEFGREIGVRFQHPFADPDVVELLYRTPPRILNKGGRSKGLVRQTLAQRFPGLGLDRQRKVLAISFFRSLLRREAPTLLDLAGNFPALSELDIVNGTALQAAVRLELSKPNANLWRIWGPINLEMWARARY
jgi:asparagine synthase (glutamine-hydrolysing)